MHFKNEHNTANFNKKGFTVVPNFLTNTLCAELSEKLIGLDIGADQSFFVSAYSTNHNYRTKIDSIIREYVTPAMLDEFIGEYDLFFANYLRKVKGVNSECVIHTDWSIVDEAAYMPLHLWIPLVDVTIENGTLAVIPGSHNLTAHYRGINIHPYYEKYYSKLQKEKSHYFEVPAGTGVFYHPGLLHFSPENTTGIKRTAILLSFTPKGYQAVIYYKKPDWFFIKHKTAMYTLTKEFYTTWDKKSVPTTQLIKYVDEPVNNLPYAEFVKQLG